MENRNNVIPIEQAGNRRTLWSFCYPHQLAADRNIGIDEKRAILAAWASDVHAVESLPTLRHLPGTPLPVTLSAIQDAQRQIDRVVEEIGGPIRRRRGLLADLDTGRAA